MSNIENISIQETEILMYKYKNSSMSCDIDLLPIGRKRAVTKESTLTVGSHN